MPTDPKSVVSVEELGKRLVEMHEWIQCQREAISEEEPPYHHEKHDLWMQLLDAEYYCLSSAEEVIALLSPHRAICPVCRGSGRMELPPTYPPKRRDYASIECKNCNATGWLVPEVETKGKPNV